MHYVVGSGPAGIACAQALVDAGAPVTLIDAGLSLEEEAASRARKLAMLAPGGWPAAEVGRLRGGEEADVGGIPLKRLFGSDFPYRIPASAGAVEAPGVGLKPSYAVGGFSNVWGAAVLPYAEEEMRGWPVSRRELDAHYEAAAGLLGLSGERDGLEPAFPLHTARPGRLPLASQAAFLRDRARRRRDPLRRAGITVGRSRLAVTGRDEAGEGGCVACGFCLQGCPYGFIYHSGRTLAALRERGLRYLPGLLAARVGEENGGAWIEARPLDGGAPFRLEGARVYLAGGVLPTARIVLDSLGEPDREIEILDSHYFLFPLLLGKGHPGVREEALHTLSQLFVEIEAGAALDQRVHIQVYGYSDVAAGALRSALGPLGRWDRLLRAAEGRLAIAQGYLHSAASARIGLRFDPATGTARLRPLPNPRTGPGVRRVLAKLARHARDLGAFPVFPLLKQGEPGRGFHSGGSFPMRHEPGRGETDRWGRLPAWRRIHLVDASVLPAIPATTITFSVMANAHRIGRAGACGEMP